MKVKEHMNNKGWYNINPMDWGINSKMAHYGSSQSQHGYEEGRINEEERSVGK